jgi:hypothetical protein
MLGRRGEDAGRGKDQGAAGAEQGRSAANAEVELSCAH